MMEDASRRVKEVKRWVTTDGHTFEFQVEATDWQEELDFRSWCEMNICCGGGWTARMVADEVLGYWMVRPREQSRTRRPHGP